MILSDLINWMQRVLKEKGDLEVYYSAPDSENKTIVSCSLITAGSGPFGANNKMVAFVSPSNMDGVFSNEQIIEEQLENAAEAAQ